MQYIIAFRPHARRSIALGVALALGLSACASTKGKKDNAYVARDVETLYLAAKDTLDRKQYEQAARMFDEVERQHPYSVWARRAQLMSAFSYFVAKNYTETISSSQRFLSLHPGSREAAYAYYMIAVSYYEQISSVQRDQRTTQQALDALGELIRRYPASDYAVDARLKVDLARDHLAGKEMEIGRYYQQQGLYLAAIIRFRTVVDQYDTTSHTPEALHRLVESYLALGVPEEAKKAAAVLGSNYPGSKWYERSYALISTKVKPARGQAAAAQ
ncbi:outer membrane protein assembly factor BamD [Polymorphobacter fuscus]|uniref:Outer membrane protein assembly factor BamD n=1 Tax=Sandarakinorhabdus fusca TaxID=1439888 RepID=A0A7C9GMS9_9SPHN|nr:outer membrane protein assembly factor BamD [Polymorphobacter fuscus]KAB7648606.1 outer membrane protein assembly factor BamD [Polymorphobacter fuscus]MQT16155.1 outer membrane protein assembly factor BamD [Polymorphobacter fuscus]NJC07566.1 outer membrane protein assembly factor BamD [Polymorphobacter fuscus]